MILCELYSRSRGHVRDYPKYGGKEKMKKKEIDKRLSQIFNNLDNRILSLELNRTEFGEISIPLARLSQRLDDQSKRISIMESFLTKLTDFGGNRKNGIQEQ
jgi:hypothetical protein